MLVSGIATHFFDYCKSSIFRSIDVQQERAAPRLLSRDCREPEAEVRIGDYSERRSEI